MQAGIAFVAFLRWIIDALTPPAAKVTMQCSNFITAAWLMKAGVAPGPCLTHLAGINCKHASSSAHAKLLLQPTWASPTCSRTDP